MTTTLTSTSTTDELMTEVLRRSEGDRRALDALSATILRALLIECDRTSTGFQAVTGGANLPQVLR